MFSEPHLLYSSGHRRFGNFLLFWRCWSQHPDNLKWEIFYHHQEALQVGSTWIKHNMISIATNDRSYQPTALQLTEQQHQDLQTALDFVFQHLTTGKF